MAKLIDGKAISKEVLDEVRDELLAIRKKNPNFTPGLAIVQVGDRSDSNVYIRNKLRSAAEVGMEARLVKLDRSISQTDLERQIAALNADNTIDGIIVQLPLDCDQNIDADGVVDGIDQRKDVDGLTRENAGRLMRGELEDTIFPCTPLGCLHLVQKATGDQHYVKGKKVVVVGRSKIVGSPAAALFMWHHGTTTICHSRTADLAEQCRQADILIVAIGQKRLIQGDWIKPGAIVIDCGINVVELENGKRQLLGDVDFPAAKEVASYITPVPGGVGPMTVAMLVRNTFQQSIRRRLNKKVDPWGFVPHSMPRPIQMLTEKLGIQPLEYESRGGVWAKVSLDVLKRPTENGKYVVVFGSRGEGKSTATIALSQWFAAATKNSIACLRQPKHSDSAHPSLHSLPHSYADADVQAVHAAAHFISTNSKCSLIGQHLADELGAVLALSSNLTDLRNRLDKTIIGVNSTQRPVTVGDEGFTGTLLVMLKDSLRPNLRQTTDGIPIFFTPGYSAHGSVIADRVAARLVGADGIVFTESGLDVEHFCEVVSASAKIAPNLAIFVVRMLTDGELAALRLRIAAIRHYGIQPIICLNQFVTDSDAEVSSTLERLEALGVKAVAANLGAPEGISDLADCVERNLSGNDAAKTATEPTGSLNSRIQSAAERRFGVPNIRIEENAKKEMERIVDWGFGDLPLRFDSNDLLSDSLEAVSDVRLGSGSGFLTVGGAALRRSVEDLDVEEETGAVVRLQRSLH